MNGEGEGEVLDEEIGNKVEEEAEEEEEDELEEENEDEEEEEMEEVDDDEGMGADVGVGRGSGLAGKRAISLFKVECKRKSDASVMRRSRGRYGRSAGDTSSGTL